MNFLEFEKPIENLYKEKKNLKKTGSNSKISVEDALLQLESRISLKKKELYGSLTNWQKIELSRHPDRPYALEYIETITNGTFVEVHGDRKRKDDKAIVTGFGLLDGKTTLFIGQQKGVTTKLKIYRNFGMPGPSGYRKAMRLMKLAEKFDIPIISFIDTPGAYPGIEAEENGQGEAIARNLFEMAKLTVPVVCIVIGEGASGGALGIGLGDRVFMMENTWFSVISPESCSSILWGNWDEKETAAEIFKVNGKRNEKARAY